MKLTSFGLVLKFLPRNTNKIILFLVLFDCFLHVSDVVGVNRLRHCQVSDKNILIIVFKYKLIAMRSPLLHLPLCF